MTLTDFVVQHNEMTTAELQELESAYIHLNRRDQTGIPELIWGENKTAEQIEEILSAFWFAGKSTLATRVAPDKAESVQEVLSIQNIQTLYYEQSRLLQLGDGFPADGRGSIAVISAGTSDYRIAEEAAVTVEFLGNYVDIFTDVGVACLQRILDLIPALQQYEIIICVAGMEGALPTVLRGLCDVPVIAVPTSVGGIGTPGMVALHGMLSSCSPGMTVVGIDGGVAAACAAHLHNRVR